ncbi:uncharacterized protein N7482_008062 [Penicillium canariense]|uniref:Uncharacterized protein n=1 Tax=Penicillium canariense TaxID=189055 RepID=A0A9W9HT84_9EURO|nr:uncharacterized protein N7482_008062 [Penicillium canariense]KAJ5156962.1 hypothetical protein N7482_008062 [Penicillium canariense]
MATENRLKTILKLLVVLISAKCEGMICATGTVLSLLRSYPALGDEPAQREQIPIRDFAVCLLPTRCEDDGLNSKGLDKTGKIDPDRTAMIRSRALVKPEVNPVMGLFNQLSSN